jgi:putative transposase
LRKIANKGELPVTDFTAKLFEAIASGQNIDELFCKELETAVNDLLKSELTVFLNYEKYDPSGYNSGNSRNGYYTRSLKTKYGEIQVEIPRDCNGEFSQQTISPYKRQTNDLETTVLQLYSKGITTSEIADLIEKMYGHAYTPATVSNMTKLVQEKVQQFHDRPLNRRYAVIYCDATYLNVRRDSVNKEALHILLGITPEGFKEIISFRLYPGESSENYREMLLDIQQRGVEEVLLFVGDGLRGLTESCLSVYTQAYYQPCWVHIQRNILRLVRAKDKLETVSNVRSIYQANSIEEAQLLLEKFIEDISFRYPKVKSLLMRQEYLFTFFKFPKGIRRSIYSTNIVEGYNKQLKKQTKRKEQFHNEESLERFVCDHMIQYNLKFSNRIHKGFNLVQSELMEMFDSLYPRS